MEEPLAASPQASLQLACRCTRPYRQIRLQPGARFLVLVELACHFARIGIVKDIRTKLLKLLYTVLFHDESAKLRSERMEMFLAFTQNKPYARVQQCILTETRLLRLEMGELALRRWIPDRVRLVYHPGFPFACRHQCLWARVGNSFENATVRWQCGVEGCDASLGELLDN